jgi:hypothetical protein
MKIIIIFLGSLLLSAIIVAGGYTQQPYTVVYDLYYQTTLYPKAGDQLIQQDMVRFDQRFHACLNQVQQRAAQASHQHRTYCNNAFIDPKSNQNCHNENEAAKIMMWVQTMRQVTQGNVRWSQTTLGQAAVMGKRQLESYYPGQYEQIVREVAPSLRSMMVCW